jgi:hypothetical protein
MAAKEPLVIVDNTNTQKWEWAIYEAIAQHLGYDVEIVVVGEARPSPETLQLYARRNLHGVPQAAIQKMADRWEDA